MGFYHKVVQGECLSSIARRYGFARWRTIYDDAANADFRTKRPNPNIIQPGDRLYIPDHGLGSSEGATDTKHRFRVTGETILVRFVVRDEGWNPLGGHRYELVVNNITYKGTTDVEGCIEHPKSGEPPISPSVKDAVLRVFVDGTAPAATAHVWNIRLGYLDPISEITGVQGRLHNLGLLHGPLSGEMDAQTEAAVHAFRQRVGLERKEFDMFDADTRERLAVGHDTKTGLPSPGGSR
jgi:N-acetylmuramoyl-L-alanine amidase